MSKLLVPRCTVIASHQTTSSTSYVVPSLPYYHYHDESVWDPTPTIYHEAVIGTSNASGTAAAQLYTVAGSAVSGSEVTTTSTTTARLRSSAITLTDATEYTTRYKNSAYTTEIMRAAVLYYLSGTIVAFEGELNVGVYARAFSTYFGLNWYGGQTLYGTKYDGTVNMYHEGTMKTNGGSPGYYKLVGTTASEISTTSSSFERVRYGTPFTETSDVVVYIQSKNSATGGEKVIIQQSASPTTTVINYFFAGSVNPLTPSSTNILAFNLPADTKLYIEHYIDSNLVEGENMQTNLTCSMNGVMAAYSYDETNTATLNSVSTGGSNVDSDTWQTAPTPSYTVDLYANDSDASGGITAGTFHLYMELVGSDIAKINDVANADIDVLNETAAANISKVNDLNF